MENLVWIIVAVVVGLFSLAGKIPERRQQRGSGPSQGPPQWPGPVAGPKPWQGVPQPQPRVPSPGSSWAPPPAGPRPTVTPPPAETPKREARRALVSDEIFGDPFESDPYETEGIGSEGIGSEGPGIGEGVEEEISRFARESEFMEQRGLDVLTDNLVRREREADLPAAQVAGPVDLPSALSDPAGLSRAVVLAEVLGRPKALRGRGARR